MSISVGQLGLGFMGTQHYRTYDRIPDAQVKAICDVDARKRAGDWSATAGNLGTAADQVDLSHLRVYADANELFADPDIDVIDITLPTYLHAEYAVRALEAGKHVISEKPIALNPDEARLMIETAQRVGRQLYVAQCIRFWPHYAVACDIIQSGKYGRVRSAFFSRRSCLPTWSWENWLMDPAKSCGCVMDMHIHDADFILHCFGRPEAVTSHGVAAANGRNDHIVTSYQYADDALIVAEGAWGYPPSYPFSMTFSIAMEQATLQLDAQMQLTLHLREGEPCVLCVDAEDGYFHELSHFITCLVGDTASPIVSPASAADALALIHTELQSLREHRSIAPSFPVFT